MVYFIPNFEIKAQIPNVPQGPKLEKKRKISRYSKLHLSKTVKARERAYEYIEIKLESP